MNARKSSPSGGRSSPSRVERPAPIVHKTCLSRNKQNATGGRLTLGTLACWSMVQPQEDRHRLKSFTACCDYSPRHSSQGSLPRNSKQKRTYQCHRSLSSLRKQGPSLLPTLERFYNSVGEVPTPPEFPKSRFFSTSFQ